MPDDLPLSVKGLTRRYGRLVGLDGLDLTLKAGECVALIGANGSGKSTAIRTMAGMLEPSEGTVRICGHDPHTEPDAEGARAALALVPTLRCSTTTSRSASTSAWSRSPTACWTRGRATASTSSSTGSG